MITVSNKYALGFRAPSPIKSDRQHGDYLLVLDKLASKKHPTSEEEKYAALLLVLIEAYEEEHHSVGGAPRGFERVTS